MPDKDVLEEAQEVFAKAVDNESDNRHDAEEDLNFGRLGDQWPEAIKTARELEGRPCLTINLMPSHIRQVTNDARQNKPSISVRPVDGGADVETAKVMNGLIRNIEQSSHADIAYDTAADLAVSMGFGYFRIDVDFTHDDSFEKEIRILQVPDPFAVYGDPWSTAADSSDWNHGFVVSVMPLDEFERKYPGAEPVDFENMPTENHSHWRDGDDITVAEYWRREEVQRTIIQISNGQSSLVVDEDVFAQQAELLIAQGFQVIDSRETLSHKVIHRIMTGVEVIEENDWAGRYIPIIPVYGEEVNIKGKRHLRSLIRDAKDPQRMFNYWRSMTTELTGLAPKAPYIGEEGAFEINRDKWETANVTNHPFLEYKKGSQIPQRQPFAGIPAGALQEALNASSDIKAVTGQFDASLGARSNETSGIAIKARQREGDVGSFHFIDNLSRSIRHAGRVVIDLIPSVYSGERIIRVLGEDGTSEDAQIAQDPDGGFNPHPRGMWSNEVYDFTVGKYDLVVSGGPSFTTRREEAATQMMDLLRAFPAAAPVIGDLLARNLDWPGAEEIAERLHTLLPDALKDDDNDPRLAQMQEAIQQLQGALKQAVDARNIEQAQMAIDKFEADTKKFDADTKRMKVVGELKQGAVELALEADQAQPTPFPSF